MINKIELIITAILVVISALTNIDFIIYVMKSAPKSRYFDKHIAIIGYLATIVLVYWFLNGMKYF